MFKLLLIEVWVVILSPYRAVKDFFVSVSEADRFKSILLFSIFGIIGSLILTFIVTNCFPKSSLSEWGYQANVAFAVALILDIILWLGLKYIHLGTFIVNIFSICATLIYFFLCGHSLGSFSLMLSVYATTTIYLTLFFFIIFSGVIGLIKDRGINN